MPYVNADDFGCTTEIIDKILNCYQKGRIHSDSAMIFMKDSERASALAREKSFSVGLHINFTIEFTGEMVKANLRNQHEIIAAYLTNRKFNQILYNPMLGKAFGYVFGLSGMNFAVFLERSQSGWMGIIICTYACI